MIGSKIWNKLLIWPRTLSHGSWMVTSYKVAVGRHHGAVVQVAAAQSKLSPWMKRTTGRGEFLIHLWPGTHWDRDSPPTAVDKQPQAPPDLRRLARAQLARSMEVLDTSGMFWGADWPDRLAEERLLPGATVTGGMNLRNAEGGVAKGCRGRWPSRAGGLSVGCCSTPCTGHKTLWWPRSWGMSRPGGEAVPSTT